MALLNLLKIRWKPRVLLLDSFPTFFPENKAFITIWESPGLLQLSPYFLTQYSPGQIDTCISAITVALWVPGTNIESKKRLRSFSGKEE